MSLLTRPLLALAVTAAAFTTAAPAHAVVCPPPVADNVCDTLQRVHVPQCWVDTYRKLVTCEYPLH